MSKLINSVVRGFGNEIGRSVARTTINKVAKGSDANYVNVNGANNTKRGKTPDRDFIKASKFKFSDSNRAGTIESKLFNLINEFENQIDKNIHYFNSDMKLVQEKLNDSYDFFKFKEYDTTKLDTLKSDFIKIVKKGFDKLQNYHKNQLSIKTVELERLKKRNKILIYLTFILFPFPLFFIKKTKIIESEIDTHTKMVNLKLDL